MLCAIMKSGIFQALSSPRRGGMSIENNVLSPPHSSGVLCL